MSIHCSSSTSWESGAYYDAFALRLADLTGRLAAESAGRIPAGAETSVGWPLSGFIYRTRTPEGRENLQLLRSTSGESGEYVLLDENILGQEAGYVEVGTGCPARTASCLPGRPTPAAPRSICWQIRDLSTGVDRPDRIERSYPGLAWSADGRYLFYLVPDEMNRPFQVRRHQLGTEAATDELVCTEDDARSSSRWRSRAAARSRSSRRALAIPPRPA